MRQIATTEGESKRVHIISMIGYRKGTIIAHFVFCPAPFVMKTLLAKPVTNLRGESPTTLASISELPSTVGYLLRRRSKELHPWPLAARLGVVLSV